MKILKIDRDSPGNEDRHYSGKCQPIDFIEDWKLGFTEGSIVEYISRHKKKQGVQDVKKAIWYLGILKARFRAGEFVQLKQPGSISVSEYRGVQNFGSLEEKILDRMLGCCLYFNENLLDEALKYAEELVSWYEATGDEYDVEFGGEDPRLTPCIEDRIFDARPSPQGAPIPCRFYLDDERKSVTQKFQVDDALGYFTVGFYADGIPGEVFVELGKEGAESHGWADCWAIAISMLLQYGVDPRKLYEKFKYMSFEPNGFTGVKGVTFCKSIPDLIMKWMEKSLPPTCGDLEGGEYGNMIEQVVEKP